MKLLKYTLGLSAALITSIAIGKSIVNTGSIPLLSQQSVAAAQAPIVARMNKCASTSGSWNNTTFTCTCPAGTALNADWCIETAQHKCTNSGGSWKNNSCACPTGKTLDTTTGMCYQQALVTAVAKGTN